MKLVSHIQLGDQVMLEDFVVAIAYFVLAIHYLHLTMLI